MSARDPRSLPLFGALALLVLAGLLTIGFDLAVAALYAYTHNATMAEAERHLRGNLLAITLMQVLALGTALVVGLRLFEREERLPEALSMRPTRAQTLALGLAAGACLQFPLSEFSNLLHDYVFGPDPIEQQLALQNLLEARNLVQGTLVIACIAGLIPLSEELLFRGLFLFGLSRRYGAAAGVLFSSVLFGLAHLLGGAVQVSYATVAGLLLGWLALVTRSVWPGVALHAAFNAVPVLLPERVVPVRGFNVPSVAVEHLPHFLIWPPLLVGLTFLAIVQRIEYVAEGEREKSDE